MEESERDWDLYTERIDGWFERCLGILHKRYMDILVSNETSPDKFWKLYRAINKDKEHLDALAALDRSNMNKNILVLYKAGVITDVDLKGFSESLIRMTRNAYLYLKQQNS